MSKHSYRSGFEHLIGADLEERGVPFDYETVTLEFRSRVRSGCCELCGECKVYQKRKYTPDFVLQSGVLVEAKGILDSKTRSKMRAVLKDNPDRDIRFLFQGKPHWKRNAEVIQWCNKFGFQYAFELVPEDWT